MYGVGSIVNVKNIIFKTTGNKSKKRVDHAYKDGRPCLVICETEENIYLLPFIGYKGKKFANEIKLSNGILNKPSCLNIRDILCKEVAYYKEWNTLSDKQLYDVLIKFINYQENVKKDEFYDSIAINVKEKVDELQEILSIKENSKVKTINSKNK